MALPGLVGERLDRWLWPFVLGQLLIVCLLAVAVWHSGRVDAADRVVGRALYAAPGSVPATFFNDITNLGSPGAAAAAAIACAGLAWYLGRDRLLAAFCPVALAAAAAVETIMKRVVGRARPSTAVFAHVGGHSFPSGHATGSAALAISAVLLLRAVRPRWSRVVVTALAVYAVLIAVSRLVIGVHFLSDVIAGDAVAGAVVLTIARLWPRSLGRLGPPERMSRSGRRRSARE